MFVALRAADDVFPDDVAVTVDGQPCEAVTVHSRMASDTTSHTYNIINIINYELHLTYDT